MMGALLHPGTVPFEPVSFGEGPAEGAQAIRPIRRSSRQGCGLSHLGACECRPVFLRLLVWALRRSQR